MGIRVGGTGAAENQLKDEIVSCFISVGCLHGPGSPRSQQLWWSRETNRFPPSIQCRTEYVTLWDTEYQEREEQVCKTVYEKQCSTRTQRLRQPTTRQECTTEYANECKDVAKTHAKQVAYQECKDVSEQKCVSVPRQ